jgi:hypothetical protein
VIPVTDLNDSWRDALALIGAAGRDDEEGLNAILTKQRLAGGGRDARRGGAAPYEPGGDRPGGVGGHGAGGGGDDGLMASESINFD